MPPTYGDGPGTWHPAIEPGEGKPRPRPAPPTYWGDAPDVYGRPVPVVYGRRWLSPMVVAKDQALRDVWYKIQFSTPANWGQAWVQSMVGTGYFQLQGKGQMALLALCEGPISGIFAISRDGVNLPVTGANTSEYLGTAPAKDGTYVAPIFYDGSQTVIPGGPVGGGGYFGTAMVCGVFALKDSDWPDIRIAVNGRLAGGGLYGGADPAAVLRDLWTNTRYGMSLDGAMLDTTNGADGTPASGYAAWLASKGWTVARNIGTKESAKDAFNSLLTETFAVPVLLPNGVIRILPLDPASPLTPQSLDQDDFQTSSVTDKPVAIERQQQADVYNVVPVAMAYGSATSADNVVVPYESPEFGDLAGKYVRADPYSAKWICDPSHAMALSFLFAQRSVLCRNNFKFKLAPRWILLTPGDLVSLTDSGLGLSGRVAMITSTDEDAKGDIAVSAVEWHGLSSPPTASPAPPDGLNSTYGGEPTSDPTATTGEVSLSDGSSLTDLANAVKDMAADSRLVYSEKLTLLTTLGSLFRDHADLMIKAALFNGVSTASYDAAFHALVTYANAPIPTWGTVASADPAVNGLGWPGSLTHTINPHAYTEPLDGAYAAWLSGVGFTGIGSLFKFQIGTIIIDRTTFQTVVWNAVEERQKLIDAMVNQVRLDLATGGTPLNEINAILNTDSLDSRLIYSEKVVVLQILQGVLRDHTDILTRAPSFAGVTTTAYEDAFHAFVTYLRAPIPGTDLEASATYTVNGLGFAGSLAHVKSPHSYTEPAASDYTAWLATGNITGRTGSIAISGPTFRSILGDVLDERQILLNGMTDRSRLDALAANTELGKIAADGWLTSPEKRAVWVDYKTLINEQATLTTQGGNQGLTALTATYTAKMTALRNYLKAPQPATPAAGGGAVSGVGIDPPTNGLNMGRATDGSGTGTDTPSDAQVATWMGYNSAIDPATLRSKFSEAYDARGALLVGLASDAWTDAKTANDELYRISTDGWLSAAEKRSTWTDYKGLTDEQAGLTSQAATQVVTSTAYVAALTALRNYMKAPQPATPPTAGGAVSGVGVVSPTNGLNMGRAVDGSGTGTDTPTDAQVAAWEAYDTAIDPATFRAKFADAYAARGALLVALQNDSWADAGAALLGLSNAASDLVITRSEKPPIFREYAALLAARASLTTQATASAAITAAVATELAAYQQRLWQLQNHMNGTLGCPPAPTGSDASPWTITVPSAANLTTWLASGNANGVAGDTALASTAVRDAFLAAWSAAYAARDSLTAKIAATGAGWAWDSTNGQSAATTAIQAGVLAGQANADVALKNSTFYQTSAPAEAGRVTGDLWFDTDDNYKIYRFDSTRAAGSRWVIATGTYTPGSGIHTYYVTTAVQRDALTGLTQGDLCFVTNEGNACYRYSGSGWVSTTLAVATIPTISTGNTAPASPKAGDLWFDTTGGLNVPKRYNGSGWDAVAGPKGATTSSGTTAPSSPGPGDIWFDTNLVNGKAGNVPKRWNGAGWDSLATPDGIHTFGPQSTAPSPVVTGDVWYDNSTGRTVVRRYNGTGWDGLPNPPAPAVTTSTGAPSSPAVGDLWIDITGGQNLFKVYTASGWVIQNKNTITTSDTQPTSPVVGDIWNTVTPTGSPVAHTSSKTWNGSAWIDLLAAQSIVASQIATGTITANEISAAYAYVGTINVNKLVGGSIDASHVTAANLNAGTINAATVTIQNLSAGMIMTGTLAAARVTAANLVSGSIDATSMTISNLSAGSIVTGTLDASRVTVSNLDASRIVSGTISADRIAANSITAKHLYLTDFTNLISNPSGVVGVNPSTGANLNGTDGWAGFDYAGRAAGIWSGNAEDFLFQTGRDNQYGLWFPVKAGDQFWCSFDSIPAGGGAGSCLTQLGLHLRTASPDYAAGEAFGAGVQRQAAEVGTLTKAGSFLVPAGYGWARVWLQQEHSASIPSAGFYYRNISVRRRNNADLIVDGAITANKIAADFVIAGKYVRTSNYVGPYGDAAGTVTGGALIDGTATTGPVARFAPSGIQIGSRIMKSAGAIVGAGRFRLTNGGPGTIQAPADYELALLGGLGRVAYGTPAYALKIGYLTPYTAGQPPICLITLTGTPSQFLQPVFLGESNIDGGGGGSVLYTGILIGFIQNGNAWADPANLTCSFDVLLVRTA